MSLYTTDRSRSGAVTARAIALALVLSLALGAGAAAGTLEKHSGVIHDVNPSAGTLVLAEVGPWQLRNGATVITYRTIAFTPETEFAIAFRAEDPDSGFSGDYVLAPIEPWAVYVGDHVTVDTRRDGRRLVAVRMVVTDMPGADF